MAEEQAQKVCPPLRGLPLMSLGWVPAIILSTGTTPRPFEGGLNQSGVECAATIHIAYQFICIEFLYAGPFVTIWDQMWIQSTAWKSSREKR